MSQLLFDCHCHLEDDVYSKDRDLVIERAREKLTGLVCSGVGINDYDKVLDFSRKYSGFVWSALGIHPEYINKFDDSQIQNAFEVIMAHEKEIVAIGEVGLDYHWVSEEKGRVGQIELFRKSIRLAMHLNKPLVVHIRDGADRERNAYEDAFEILEKEKATKVLLHMFGIRKLLDRAILNGWYISTNAISQSSKESKRVVRAAPLERFLLETDSPYLVPQRQKNAGQIRNEPAFIEEIAQRVAQVKEMNLQKVIDQTTQNAKDFFAL